MKPLQKLTYAGVEVLLFPLEYMNISQGENGSYSHAGTLCIDFLGWNGNGRVYNCPYYAPCSMSQIRHTDSYVIWQSDNPVLLADGSTDYVTINFAHDNNALPLNTHVNQGDLIGHTGIAGNVTGDHVHMNIAKGKYASFENVPPVNNSQLVNSISIYNACYLNDTYRIEDNMYIWKYYSAPVPIKKKSKFKWVLYINKLRSKKS